MAVTYIKRPAKRGLIQSGKKSVKSADANFFIKILAYLFPVKGDGLAEGLRKIVFTGALAAFIFFGGTSGFDLLNELWQNYKIESNIAKYGDSENLPSDVVEKMREAEILEEYMGWYNANKDFVGWVRIGDTVINYPVCKTTDNKYYLDRAFDHSYSKGGTIFADCRNKFGSGYFDQNANSANIVLYGHNITTGNYFTRVSSYYTSTDLKWYRDYPVINFDTLYEKAEWKIFACVLFNTQEKYGEVYDYTSVVSFSDKNDFNNYILDIMDRSVLFTDVDIKYGDSLLTLSTCYYPMSKSVDTRCVVFARKVRPGESAYVDTSVAVYNTSEKKFAEQEKRYGSNWRGRVWDTSKLLSYEEDL